jgi:ABC-type Fe3+/spermidine/putrescine transport system ATPase subunit
VRIAVQNITKRFGAMAAADDVTLTVEEGELFTLLGPSGCGKTTLLRVIAGFYAPDEGEIRFDDRRVNEVPPHERGIGMVFQNYALWPHMTVADNVGYGLKLRKVPGSELEQRVHAVLEKVKLGGLDKRYPGQLSGGQQQRVALARALVLNPEILLLDEPLSNLDAKIRIQVRAEIRKLQKELGITTIYVTHDQEEALTLSDRMAVFDKGRMLEVGPPKTLYEHPRTRFVADFIGINNLIEATVTSVDAERGRLRARTVLGEWSAFFTEARPVGSACVLGIRPENIALDGGAAGVELNVAEGQITFAAYLGNTLRYDVDLGQGVVFKADIRDPWHHVQLALGATVRLAFPAGDTVAIAAD